MSKDYKMLVFFSFKIGLFFFILTQNERAMHLTKYCNININSKLYNNKTKKGSLLYAIKEGEAMMNMGERYSNDF